MGKAYSQDLRDRVIEAVVTEGMSRRAAADRFGIGDSSAIRWVGRYLHAQSRRTHSRGRLETPRLSLEKHLSNRKMLSLWCLQ